MFDHRELTRGRVLADRALRCGNTALCLQSYHTSNNREILCDLMALLCPCMAYILCMNQKSNKWPWVGPFKMNVKIKQGSNFDSCLFFDAQEA